MARKQNTPVSTSPAEPRRLMVALSVAEATLALLFAWALARSSFARHASLSARTQPEDVLVLAAAGGCLALFVFVLGFWQWRLSGRARMRFLLVVFLSLVVAFCSFCWYDVSVRVAELNRQHGTPSARAELREQTAAVLLTIGALVLGLIGVIVVLWLERRGRQAAS